MLTGEKAVIRQKQSGGTASGIGSSAFLFRFPLDEEISDQYQQRRYCRHPEECHINAMYSRRIPVTIHRRFPHRRHDPYEHSRSDRSRDGSKRRQKERCRGRSSGNPIFSVPQVTKGIIRHPIAVVRRVFHPAATQTGVSMAIRHIPPQLIVIQAAPTRNKNLHPQLVVDLPRKMD